jgi:EpsI family protein
MVGDLLSINVVQQFALVCLLALSVPLLLGWAITRLLVFPLTFLFLAVPVGQSLTPHLMDWTADFTVMALRASGIPVYRDGLYFVIPSGAWSVVEACSGVRYLMAMVTVGTLFAYLHFRSWRYRALMIGLSVFVPLVANWLRAYAVVVIGHLSGNEYGTGFDHIVGGWVFFGIATAVLLGIGLLLREPAASVVDTAPGMATVSAPGLSPALLLMALVGAGVAGGPTLLGRWVAASGSMAPVHLAALAPAPGWRVIADPLPAWQPPMLAPAAVSRTAFEGPDGARVGVLIAYFRAQHAGSKLVSSGNDVLPREPDGLWQGVWHGSMTTAALGDITAVSARELRTNDGAALEGGRLLTWPLYWVDGRFTGKAVQALLFDLSARLRHRRDDGAWVVFFTPVSAPDREPQPREAAAARLERFVQAHRAGIERVLQLARPEN